MNRCRSSRMLFGYPVTFQSLDKEKDPDLVEHNFELLRQFPLPKARINLRMSRSCLKEMIRSEVTPQVVYIIGWSNKFWQRFRFVMFLRPWSTCPCCCGSLPGSSLITRPIPTRSWPCPRRPGDSKPFKPPISPNRDLPMYTNQEVSICFSSAQWQKDRLANIKHQLEMVPETNTTL